MHIFWTSACTQVMGFMVSDDELKTHGVTREDPASKARSLIEKVVGSYANTLDVQAVGGKAKLLAAYSRIVCREESLLLAAQLHTQKYTSNGIGRGRRHFLTYLESIGHVCMSAHSCDMVMRAYKNPDDNLVELTELLSHVTPTDGEKYLALFASKNAAARERIINIGQGRTVTSCVGHSAVCAARSAAASLWRAIDQCNKWAPLPYDPMRGTGCPFYHERITRGLMNKQKLDIREGRGKQKARLVYVEDHVAYSRKVLEREVLAYHELQSSLQKVPVAGGSDSPPATALDLFRGAWAAWARRLILAEVVRFVTGTQREGGQRAELANLTAAELVISFDSAEELPSITKKRQGGTRSSEACRMRHWGCGPYCHSAYVKVPDSYMPTVGEMCRRAQLFLQLAAHEQGICGACAYVMTEAVLNVSWHAQNASSLPPEQWPATSRNPLINSDLRQVFFLPELRLSDVAKKAALSLDSNITPIFSPQRARDAKPDTTTTKYTRLLIGVAWPDGYRITQFGNVPVEASEFTAHGIKSGSVTDLGMSKAPPALALAHAHQENMSTNAMYHVWELEATDYARNLLCQPRLVSAGLCISLMHVHAYVRIRMYAYAYASLA